MVEANWLDGSLYPDVEVPPTLDTLAEKVDFLARLCSAWDFGILPRQATVTEIRNANWKPAVDACRLLTSPAYHLLRRWHGLPPLAYLGQQSAIILNDPWLAYV
jgi:hypothetical protein